MKENEVNEVVEIHEKIPNEFWGINSGNFLILDESIDNQ